MAASRKNAGGVIHGTPTTNKGAGKGFRGSANVKNVSKTVKPGNRRGNPFLSKKSR